jgi:hypothetical protein
MTLEHTALDERILALDVRPHWFGFAVFNDLNNLADFGLVKFPSFARGKARIVQLMKMFWPVCVVIRRTVPRARQHRLRTMALMREVLRVSGRFAINAVRISDTQLRRYLASQSVTNKDQAASLHARRFPELSWKLPPPRKRWQHEHQNMPIFDAVAIGLAHLEMQDTIAD